MSKIELYVVGFFGVSLVIGGIAIEVISALNHDPTGLFTPATVIAVSGGVLLGYALIDRG